MRQAIASLIDQVGTVSLDKTKMYEEIAYSRKF